MFRSPYSPFFTSGLLSQTPSPTASSEPRINQRRGSLPTDSTSSGPRSTISHPSAFYCNLQPKRDINEFRSFLSLDLAESQSMRSFSKQFRSSNPSSRQDTSFFPNFPTIPETPSASSSRRRSSRDSLWIPSPKPVPSTSLPHVPTPITDSPPRLPPIPTTPPLTFSTLQVASRPFPLLLPVDALARNRDSSVSTSPTWYRVVSRKDALARLEGRIKPSQRIQRNFMNMSDDDDDDDDGIEEEDESALEEPQADSTSDFARVVQLAAMLDQDSPPTRESRKFTRPPRNSTRRSRNSIPTIKSKSITPLSPSSKRRTMATESWFPLASFTDEDPTWNWRSFIEIANVS